MIVTVEMLQDYMSGVQFNSKQEQAAEYVIAGVQNELERYLHRRLEPTTTTESVTADPQGYLLTSWDPILSVPADSPFQFYGGRIWNYALSTDPIYTMSTFRGVGDQFYTVTYTHGYDARHDHDETNDFADVRLSVMRVASREMTNRHDDTLSVKSLTMTNQGEPTGPQNGVQGWTMDELRLFDRLRKRVIV